MNGTKSNLSIIQWVTFVVWSLFIDRVFNTDRQLSKNFSDFKAPITNFMQNIHRSFIFRTSGGI